MPALLLQRLPECRNLRSLLDCVLSRGLEVTGAALGNIQLMDWKSGALTIAAQHGFNEDFLRVFSIVTAADGSVCGRAVRGRCAIIVEDVLRDAAFAPYRAAALDAGFRAVQSTPLISRSGAFIGMLSTHFPAAHRPSELEMEHVATIAEVAAGAIIRQRIRARHQRREQPSDTERVAAALRAIERSYHLLQRTRR
jgi:GAF domain-containing protein